MVLVIFRRAIIVAVLHFMPEVICASLTFTIISPIIILTIFRLKLGTISTKLIALVLKNIYGKFERIWFNKKVKKIEFSFLRKKLLIVEKTGEKH